MSNYQEQSPHGNPDPDSFLGPTCFQLPSCLISFKHAVPTSCSICGEAIDIDSLSGNHDDPVLDQSDIMRKKVFDGVANGAWSISFLGVGQQFLVDLEKYRETVRALSRSQYCRDIANKKQ